MSWLFSRALVAEYSAANSSAGAPSAPSSTTPTPPAFLWRDKTTDAWSRFPSGMTCEPLTDDRGEALLTWFREGSHAPTSVPPARAPESPASSQDCGPRWRALSVKFDRASSSWKTAHCLLSEDLPWSSVTLPKWGMMRAGELWERTTLALPTSGTDAGFWPTPNASDSRGAGKNGKLRDRLDYAVERGATKKKTYWPTPCANEDAAGRPGSKMQKMLGNHPDIRGDLTGGTLNPFWVEWLMGFPIGLTALKPLETPKFQQWLLSHGVSSAAPDSTQPHTC
jgi:hypothetical protein